MAKQTTTYLKLAVVTAIYIALCVLYFSRVGLPYKIALPVGSLLISALWVSPWQIAVALLCSAAGDVFGAQGNFIWQMGAFALAHVFFIWFFISRFFHINGMTSVRNILLTTLLVIGVCVFALYFIIPHIPTGTMRHGAIIYAVIISIMLWCSLLQKDVCYAIAGILFVVSDMVLGWNRFVSHIPYAVYFIMIPYYTSQILFFIRSTKS